MKWKCGNLPPSLGKHPTDSRIMGALDPIAFDIETSGLEPGSVITVAGLATDMGACIVA